VFRAKEEEQNATLALLEARNQEELAKARFGIALQRSRALAGAVLFTEMKAAERVFDATPPERSTASRLAALGELAGSIVREVNQPRTALITSA
jgi:C4-dicarboxylate-specific signal transduction histidine kinase